MLQNLYRSVLFGYDLGIIVRNSFFFLCSGLPVSANQVAASSGCVDGGFAPLPTRQLASIDHVSRIEPFVLTGACQSAVLPSQDFQDTMGPRIEDDNQVGLVTSLLLVGAFFSTFLAGTLADRFGRRVAILTGAVIFMLGGALQTGAQSIGKPSPNTSAPSCN